MPTPDREKIAPLLTQYRHTIVSIRKLARLQSFQARYILPPTLRQVSASRSNATISANKALAPTPLHGPPAKRTPGMPCLRPAGPPSHHKTPTLQTLLQKKSDSAMRCALMDHPPAAGPVHHLLEFRDSAVTVTAGRHTRLKN